MMVYIYFLFQREESFTLNDFADVPKATIPKELTVCYGSETIFNPEVVSCPLPDGVQWQKSKFDDNETFECIDVNEAKYFGSCLDPESPKLVITKTTFEDMPYYRLLIWNKIGERYSNTTHLNVTGSMTFAVALITMFKTHPTTTVVLYIFHLHVIAQINHVLL